MRSELDEKIKLKHILGAIEEIKRYLSEVNFPDFLETQ